jgi:PIN domain nuclease of toxin-antitoxin system
VRLLLDTHVLLWATMNSPKLAAPARRLLNDPDNELLFSAVSIWEIAIKNRLGRPHFMVDPLVLRNGLLSSKYGELAITSVHGAATESLPLLHHDPFDRLLIAQATSEGLVLLTSDKDILRYPGPIRRA